MVASEQLPNENESEGRAFISTEYDYVIDGSVCSGTWHHLNTNLLLFDCLLTCRVIKLRHWIQYTCKTCHCSCGKKWLTEDQSKQDQSVQSQKVTNCFSSVLGDGITMLHICGSNGYSWGYQPSQSSFWGWQIGNCTPLIMTKVNQKSREEKHCCH